MIMSSRSIFPISIVSKVQSQDTVKSVSRCSHFLRSQKSFFFLLATRAWNMSSYLDHLVLPKSFLAIKIYSVMKLNPPPPLEVNVILATK